MPASWSPPRPPAAKQAGWEVERLRSGEHYRFLSPDKNVRPITITTSGADHRALANSVATLRRAGLEI